jgi:hypothetical protein
MGAEDWELLRDHALVLAELWEEAAADRDALEEIWRDVHLVTDLAPNGDTEFRSVIYSPQVLRAWDGCRDAACPMWPEPCPAMEGYLRRVEAAS